MAAAAEHPKKLTSNRHLPPAHPEVECWSVSLHLVRLAQCLLLFRTHPLAQKHFWVFFLPENFLSSPVGNMTYFLMKLTTDYS
jgi:hypothetical protein